MTVTRTESFARFPRLDGMPDQTYDVAILGGGLAGLTLGLQLKQRRPQTSIVISEKREGPAPTAAFKVGESTVEIGAHYFADVIGLKDHIDAHQLPKCALRFFFPARDNSDIAQRVEWGLTAFPPVHSYQLDRGIFENELLRRNLVAGVHAFDGCRVEAVELGGEKHSVVISRGDDQATFKARWVIDAAGRRFILKKRLALLEDTAHDINSAWLRLAGGLDIESLSNDETWLNRMPERGLRKQSTNHLMGDGYWVWLIPLSSGSISIGIVADPRLHPMEQMGTLEAAVEWLNRHEPQVGAVIGSRLDQVEDFLKVQKFSHGAKRVFSPERWALTGEAGVFIDPFYSPGSDYIAISNTYITELVVRDLDGEDVTSRCEAYNDAYLSQFAHTISSVYNDQYPHWGNVEVMGAKLVWDYTQYWSLLALPFFYGKLTDLEYMAEVAGDIDRGRRLTERISQLFRDWGTLARQHDWSGIFINGLAFPAMGLRHVELGAGLDEATLRARFEENSDLLEAIAVVIFHKAAQRLPSGGPGAEEKINPYAISLDPDQWQADGLFDGSGLTLTRAREMTPGLENMWVENLVAAA